MSTTNTQSLIFNSLEQGKVKQIQNQKKTPELVLNIDPFNKQDPIKIFILNQCTNSFQKIKCSNKFLKEYSGTSFFLWTFEPH